jgi:hypothetical protein
MKDMDVLQDGRLIGKLLDPRIDGFEIYGVFVPIEPAIIEKVTKLVEADVQIQVVIDNGTQRFSGEFYPGVNLAEVNLASVKYVPVRKDSAEVNRSVLARLCERFKAPKGG